MSSPYDNGGIIGPVLDLGTTDSYTTGSALSVSYITVVNENAPGATSHTFSGVSTTGLTSSDTLIVVFHSEVSLHSTGDPVTSITVNGSSATIDFQTPTTALADDNIGITAVARISGITASSVNIVVTYPNQSILRAAVSTYIVADQTSLTVLDTDEFSFVGTSTSQTLTTNVENGGLVIYGLSIGDENDTTAWSDATETYDQGSAELNSQWAGAYYLPTTTESHVETLTLTGAIQNGVGLAVSYETEIVVKNKKNTGIWNLNAVYNILNAPLTLSTDSLSSWTISDAADVRISAANGNPLNCIETDGGGYAYIDTGITNWNNKKISFDVFIKSGTNQLGNFYFACNSSGSGQHARLEARATEKSGFSSTTSWTVWAAEATGGNTGADSWLPVEIEINGSGQATLKISGSTFQSGYSITNNGGYVGVHGDSSVVSGCRFDNIVITDL